MKPKEKAIELVEWFDCNTVLSLKKAKECALKCVDEIIQEANWWHSTSRYEDATEFSGGLNRVKYLESVKTEIEIL